jgi:hypothetical protein
MTGYLWVAIGWLADNNVWLELLEPSDEVNHVGSGLRPEIFPIVSGKDTSQALVGQSLSIGQIK